MLKKLILPFALVLSPVHVLWAAVPTNVIDVSKTGAHFTPKLMVNDKPATTDRFIASDKINLSVDIKVDGADVGQSGVYYVVILWNDSIWMMKNDQGNLVPWNVNLADLVPYLRKETLPEEDVGIDLLSGLGGLTGKFVVFFGYQNSQTMNLIYNATPLMFTVQSVQQVMSTSLHGTTRGMGHFYGAEQGGFEQFTHIPYEDLSSCLSCHVEQTSCTTCHENPGDKPGNEKCFDCHGRQRSEHMSNPDIHLTPKADGGLGMRCADCHSAKQVHGDGHEYVSVNDPAHQNKVNCQQSGCHTEITIAGKTMHEQHKDDLDCAACHVKSTTTCYSCHFEDGSAFQPPITDWKILVKRKSTGKVTTGNIQTMAAGGNSFVVVAPYFGHTVQKDSTPTCSSCHDSDAVREYKDNGIMTLATWHDADKTISNIKGVVPIPLDWETALQMPFIAKNADGEWAKVKDSADATQMLFAEPIDVGSLPKY